MLRKFLFNASKELLHIRAPESKISEISCSEIPEFLGDPSELPTEEFLTFDSNEDKVTDTIQITGKYLGDKIFEEYFNSHKITVGRSKQCDLSFSNYAIAEEHLKYVSRVHLTLIKLQTGDKDLLYQEGNKYIIIDGVLNGSKSKNGFYANYSQKKISAHQLVNLDSIQIGTFLELEFAYIDAEIWRDSEDVNLDVDGDTGSLEMPIHKPKLIKT